MPGRTTAILLAVPLAFVLAAGPATRPTTTFAPPPVRLEGKYVTIDVTAAPDLKGWAETTLLPVCEAWYPKIVEMLPSDGFEAPRRFTVRFRDDLGGTPAHTSRDDISCNVQWFRRELNREAAGAVVHEMVHVVQQYGHARRRLSRDDGGGAGDGEKAKAAPNPGWLVEGIADYIRWFQFEPESRGGAVRDVNKARHDASYRVSANFIDWVQRNHDARIVASLNDAMRKGEYDQGLWKQHTGRTIEELGAEWKQSLLASRDAKKVN